WGNKPGQWTENTRARVSEEVQAVKHWVILRDAYEVFNHGFYDEQEITWFIDPPYEYNYAYKSPIQDYTQLGKLVTNLKGQRIICEAVCPKTGKIPSWLDFKPWAERITSRRKAGEHTHSKELICVLY